MGIIKTGSSALHLHVCVPLVGGSVEKAPAGSILRRHHAPIQTTQHGHHIVLDGACNGKVLEELRPAMKPHVTGYELLFLSWTEYVLFCLSARWPVFNEPEDGCTAKACGHAEMWVWLRERRQEVTATAPILPGDQLAGVPGCEEVPVRPITTCKRKRNRKNVKQTTQMNPFSKKILGPNGLGLNNFLRVIYLFTY